MKFVQNENSIQDVYSEMMKICLTIGARARFAVNGRASEWIAIETASASFAVLSGRVVLTDTASTLGVTNVGVTVTVAGYAASEGSTVGRFMSVAWSARLAELTNVTFWTVATFDPVGRRTAGAATGRFQLDVIEETDTTRGVRSADLERR